MSSDRRDFLKLAGSGALAAGLAGPAAATPIGPAAASGRPANGGTPGSVDPDERRRLISRAVFGAKDPAEGDGGMVICAQPLATRAGTDVLRAGGNAPPQWRHSPFSVPVAPAPFCPAAGIDITQKVATIAPHSARLVHVVLVGSIMRICLSEVLVARTHCRSGADDTPKANQASQHDLRITGVTELGRAAIEVNGADWLQVTARMIVSSGPRGNRWRQRCAKATPSAQNTDVLVTTNGSVLPSSRPKLSIAPMPSTTWAT